MSLYNIQPSAVIDMSCSCLSLSLPPNIFSLFSPVRAYTHSHQAELWRQRSRFPRFLLKWRFVFSTVFNRAFRQTLCDSCKFKDSQTGSHLGRDDPKRSNQIKIIPFIQTSLSQSQSVSPKDTTRNVYKMSFFLVACLPNKWHKKKNVPWANLKGVLMTGIFPASVPGCFGDERVCSFGFKTERRHCFLFGWVGKRRHHVPWSSNCVSLYVDPSNSPNFYIISTVSAVVVSLYATGGMCWFGMCWGHVTDVSRTGCARLGSATRTRLILRVGGRWKSTSLRALLRKYR